MKYRESDSPILGKRLIIVSVILLLIVVGAIVYIWYTISAPGSLGAKEEITIPQGASGNQVAKLLSDKHVISNVAIFKLYVKLGHNYDAKAGLYTFHRHEPYSDVLAQLHKGSNIKVYRVTFPEGFRVQQMADRLAAKVPGHTSSAFMSVAQSGQFTGTFVTQGTTDLQGYLFPDTYNISENATDQQIIQMMIDRLDQKAASLDLNSGASALGYTPRQILTVASLIEKEVKRPQDRAPAAGVIYNRLKIGQPLQLDSTATYASGTFDRATLPVDRLTDSPYNTFKVPGLPIGPIDSPGAAAIEAALHPSGDFLYFITVNDCTNETVFTKTYAEFNVANARRHATDQTCASTTTTAG